MIGGFGAGGAYATGGRMARRIGGRLEYVACMKVLLQPYKR